MNPSGTVTATSYAPSVRRSVRLPMSTSSGTLMEKSGDSDRTLWGERISNALRALYPTSVAKNLARDAQASQRTAEKWLDGSAMPSLVHFANLIDRHPQLFAVLQPAVAWAEVAVTAVETVTLDQQRADVRARMDRATSRMRSL